MRKKTYYDDDCSKKIHEGLVVLEVWDGDDGDGDDAQEVCDGDDAQEVCGGGGDAWRNCYYCLNYYCCCSKKNYYSKKKNWEDTRNEYEIDQFFPDYSYKHTNDADNKEAPWVHVNL